MIDYKEDLRQLKRDISDVFYELWRQQQPKMIDMLINEYVDQKIQKIKTDYETTIEVNNAIIRSLEIRVEKLEKQNDTPKS